MIPVESSETFGPVLSLLIGYGLGVIVLGSVLARARVRWLQFARDAELAKAAFDPDDVVELREGPAIIAGVVQLAAEASSAVKVEIEQDATEAANSGVWSHRWTEVDRRVHVAPFYLERSHGERVRVQPTQRVLLIDAMDACVHVDERRRKRIAELTPGETVIAKGVLRRDFDPEAQPSGYRDAATGWVMGPPRGARMLLSSEPLEARFVRWRDFHRDAAVLLLLAFMSAQALLFTYHCRVFAGTTSIAQVSGMRHFRSKDLEGEPVDHWEVTARTTWGTTHTEELERDSYERLEVGSAVPIRHSGWHFVQFGARPRLHDLVAVILLGLPGTALVTYSTMLMRKKPWYSSQVVDRDGGRIDPNTGLNDPLG